jgi:predicted Rossmann-fold nucleotide-binding protein
MKAPDKIYLQVCGDCKDNDCKNCKFEDLEEITWCKDKIFEKDIEYIRTDAFIEKACEWLQNHTMKELCMKEEDSGLVQEFIESFKKAMEE